MVEQMMTEAESSGELILSYQQLMTKKTPTIASKTSVALRCEIKQTVFQRTKQMLELLNFQGSTLNTDFCSNNWLMELHIYKMYAHI